ncbi:methyl-accepting chemotaxis protein [Paenibacillus chungangensis]|uniref:Methyl-accepting chemotaxis protein n=1 Tax=Paenibacillus chungangensis TaxID=696535 RepID=A0ABW3HVL5_9BACL
MKLRFGIVGKMVLGITACSIVTYSTSAFFLLVLMDIFPEIPDMVFIVGTLAMGIFWTGLFGYIATKMLLKPLQAVTAAVQEAATGNLNAVNIPVKSKDEMGQLIESLQFMMGQFSMIVKGIKENSMLTDRHIQELQGAITQSAVQLEGLANESEKITTGTGEQAEAAGRLNESADALYQSSLDMQEEALQTKQRSIHMNTTADQSGEVFRSLVDGMHHLEELNKSAMDVVKKMSLLAEQIGSISEVVGDIADQTHLLALNAAIEAARAGEEGRGFVVVAHEVKTLADRSGKAVDEIRQLVEQVETGVGNAVGYIEKQYEVSHKEAKQGEQFAVAFMEVKREAELVARAVEMMAVGLAEQTQQVESSREQTGKVAGAADHIRGGAQHIFAASQQQAAVMEEIAASTDELRAKSTDLLQKAAYFRT